MLTWVEWIWALSDFRPCIHGRKWYWQLLVNALNISVVFTWRLYLLIHSKCMPQKEFRMALVECMTRSSAPLAMSSLTRPGPNTNALDRIRKDNIGHHPRKCVVCKKSARIPTMCEVRENASYQWMLSYISWMKTQLIEKGNNFISYSKSAYVDNAKML